MKWPNRAKSFATHLSLCQRPSEADAAPDAERDELLDLAHPDAAALRVGLEEALGVEPLRLGEDLGVVQDAVQVGNHVRPPRDGVAEQTHLAAKGENQSQ